MKQIIIIISLFVISNTITAQTVDCASLVKGIAGAVNNFEGYTNFQYLTKGGQKAYLADFSFVTGTSGYIYKDAAANENYFFQTVSSDVSQYSIIYRQIETCLLQQTDKWSKLDLANGKSASFSCYTTGAQIFLISNETAVIVKIVRDKMKSIPVFAPGFCDIVKQLAASCTGGFTAYRGAYKDSSVLGKSWKCTLLINQRNGTPTIYEAKDFLDKTKLRHSLSTMIMGYDMTYADVQKQFVTCLKSEDGWKTTPSTFNNGIIFYKDGVSVEVYTIDKNDAPDTFISITNSIPGN